MTIVISLWYVLYAFHYIHTEISTHIFCTGMIVIDVYSYKPEGHILYITLELSFLT